MTDTDAAAVLPDGLSSAEAAARLARSGPNQLPEAESPGPVAIFVNQFRSPFIYVLLAASLVSFGLGQYVNAWFILAVLLINAAIGTFQEFSAERAAAALRNLVPSFTTVVRDGRVCRIDSVDVVPGDVLQLISGDRIPADFRLLTAHDLEVDESMLTGESLPVSKRADGEHDRCFAGTMIQRGRVTGEVTATGIETEIGRIAHHVTGEDLSKPPLRLRIERFTMLVSIAMVILIALIFVVTLLRGDDLATVFLIGVALAVSAIPEGLPAAITVALAIGMQRMSRVGVIIRKLLAVEALGSCTMIASDKTGTLTVNEMTIKRVVLPHGATYEVSGEGIDPHGAVACDDAVAREHISRLARCAVLANEAELTQEEAGWNGNGDMVDIAFLVLAHKLGLAPARLREEAPRVAQIPYESELAYCASLHRGTGGFDLCVKGALEKILPMCTRVDGGGDLDTAAITETASQLAAAGYRVLAIAASRPEPAPAVLENALEGLDFLGIVGIIDPVRPEAVYAIDRCTRAEIRTAMITGDHPETALAIARELGLAVPGDAAVSGVELATAEARGTEAVDELVLNHRVFARIAPVQKMLITERLIEHGHYVAVTGDGVNDAPALRRAHVGVAMGGRGTDVARESADLILTDDNFSSIVNGIREGRIVYGNIRKVIFLLISTGAAEITLFLWSLAFGLPLPLFPIQLLWLNLVTNGVQDVALAFEPAEGDELERPPRRPSEPVFDRLMTERVVLNALFMGSLAFAVFFYALSTGASEEAARNTTLLLMVLFENVHALNSRSERASLFSMRFFGNPLLIGGILIAQAIHIGSMYLPGLSTILGVAPVAVIDWLQLAAIALLLLAFDEVHKWRLRRGETERTS